MPEDLPAPPVPLRTCCRCGVLMRPQDSICVAGPTAAFTVRHHKIPARPAQYACTGCGKGDLTGARFEGSGERVIRSSKGLT